MDPFMQESIMSSTGMPALGRRAKGFGSSPFGPGGPVPVHQMNFLLGGMGRHGMLNTPYSAGRYPNPQPPFPLGYTAGNPMMSAAMPGLGMGMPCMPHAAGGRMPHPMMGLGMMFPGAMGMGYGGIGVPPPWMMGMGAAGLDAGAMGLLDACEEADDTGVWDEDEDGDGMTAFDSYIRAMRKAKRKNRVCGMPGMGAGMYMPGMPMGGAMPGMGMPGIGMPGIGCY